MSTQGIVYIIGIIVFIIGIISYESEVRKLNKRLENERKRFDLLSDMYFKMRDSIKNK